MLILMVWIEFPMEGGDNTACHGLHVGSLALLDEVAPLSLFGRGECVRLISGSRANLTPCLYGSLLACELIRSNRYVCEYN